MEKVRFQWPLTTKNFQTFGEGERREREKEIDRAGNTNCGGMISTVDLLIKVACIVKNINNIFSIKRS